jgi:hypothetical protein
MATRTYELWEEVDGNGQLIGYTFCVAGPDGNQARSMLETGARVIWSVEAESYNEAMTKYHQFMKWEPYKPAFEKDWEPHPE